MHNTIHCWLAAFICNTVCVKKHISWNVLKPLQFFSPAKGSPMSTDIPQILDGFQGFHNEICSQQHLHFFLFSPQKCSIHTGLAKFPKAKMHATSNSCTEPAFLAPAKKTAETRQNPSALSLQWLFSASEQSGMCCSAENTATNGEISLIAPLSCWSWDGGLSVRVQIFQVYVIQLIAATSVSSRAQWSESSVWIEVIVETSESLMF